MRVYGSAAERNGVVYFGCFDGKVYGVDHLTGEIRWEFQTDASRSGYDEIFDAEGGFKKGFELYGPETLESEKKIHALGSVLSSVVIRNDLIYFGSSDGNLYAVQLPSGQ
jgi:outer membrane protein assembly factor BamB